MSACVGLVFSAWGQQAQKGAGASMPLDAVASVGGTLIPEKAVNAMLANLKNQGKPVTPQLREQVITQLVLKRVLLDEAKLQKLDSSNAYIEKREEAGQNLLIEMLLSGYMVKNAPTEADEKAEYSRQYKLLVEGEKAVQYQLRQVLLKTEQEARTVISRSQKGESFETLAAESIDVNARANNGLIGWILPYELLPAVSSVVVNLSKGAITAAPIQTPVGWVVVKVEDLRDYKIPSFEEARARIRQNLMVKRQQAVIEGLVKKADIKRP
jgi:peptidyl-prolyl cis-trans isomerase C